jgi:hypothetical protein
MAYDRLARANQLLSDAQARGADTGRGVPKGDYIRLTTPTTIEPSKAPPVIADVPPAPASAPAVGPKVAKVAKVVTPANPVAATAAPAVGGVSTTSAVGPVKPTKGIFKNGVIQPRDAAIDPVTIGNWNKQMAEDAYINKNPNSGVVFGASSNVPGAPAINPGRHGVEFVGTNDVVGAIDGKRYAGGKPGYDEAGIAAAKADLARQVAFKPGARSPQSSGPYFNLRPRKGVEEANAVAAGAIGAINAKGGYDERIADKSLAASQADKAAARTEAGMDRTSKENIEKGKNEAAVAVGVGKNLNYSDRLKQNMNTSAFMAQMSHLREAAKTAITDADKEAITAEEQRLVAEFRGGGAAPAAGAATPAPAVGEKIRITRGGKPGTINPADFNPATDVRL